MVTTRILQTDFWKLNLRPDNATLIIRLMMAANDLVVANACLKRYTNDEEIDPSFRRGARMYFVNLQCGHLAEGLKIIRDIRNNVALYQEVERCPRDIQEAFTTLVSLASEGTNEEFDKYVKRIRDKAAFHYYDKEHGLLLAALDRRAASHDLKRSKISTSSDAQLTRFTVADDMNDTIVCRFLWEIEEQDLLGEEANRILEQIASWVILLLNFSGVFIYQYITDHAMARW